MGGQISADAYTYSYLDARVVVVIARNMKKFRLMSS